MKKAITNLSLFLFFCTITFAQNNTQNQERNLNTTSILDANTAIKSDSLVLSKSSEMLDEDRYWDIIANSLKETDNQEDQELYLIAEIEKMTPEEMIGFRLRTDKLLFDTYNQELWCASYIMNRGVSDGGFEYFRCWLISKGKEAFYNAKLNPDNLINQVIKDQELYEFEGFWYVAITAFKNKTDQELYSYIDYDKFITNDENYPLLKFTWDADEPQTMGKICPVLFKNLWK